MIFGQLWHHCRLQDDREPLYESEQTTYMRDAAMDVEEAMHVFMQHVDSSDVGKLVRAMLLYRSTQQG